MLGGEVRGIRLKYGMPYTLLEAGNALQKVCSLASGLGRIDQPDDLNARINNFGLGTDEAESDETDGKINSKSGHGRDGDKTPLIQPSGESTTRQQKQVLPVTSAPVAVPGPPAISTSQLNQVWRAAPSFDSSTPAGGIASFPASASPVTQDLITTTNRADMDINVCSETLQVPVLRPEIRSPPPDPALARERLFSELGISTVPRGLLGIFLPDADSIAAAVEDEAGATEETGTEGQEPSNRRGAGPGV